MRKWKKKRMGLILAVACCAAVSGCGTDHKADTAVEDDGGQSDVSRESDHDQDDTVLENDSVLDDELIREDEEEDTLVEHETYFDLEDTSVRVIYEE